MKKLNIVINNDMWQVKVISKRRLKELHQECLAVCCPDIKVIYIRQDSVNYITIAHEVFHLYMSYCYISSAQIDGDAIEEVSAEMFAHKGQEMIDTASYIFNNLTK